MGDIIHWVLNWIFGKRLPKEVEETWSATIGKMTDEFNGFCTCESGYFGYGRYSTWLTAAQFQMDLMDNGLKKSKATEGMKKQVLHFRLLINNSEKQRRQSNDLFMRREIEAQKAFFEAPGRPPLDEQQRRAVVCDEDQTLVLAGAGSGKTSVIAAKVAYLVKVRKVPEREILLLTYSKKARGVMDDRVKGNYGVMGVPCKTIHALGLSVIQGVEGRSPRMLEEDKAPVKGSRLMLEETIFQTLMAENKDFVTKMMGFLQEFLEPVKTEWDFNNLEEWEAYILGLGGHYTLSNHKVRSYEEKMIANYLFTHGIKFDYERSYEVDTATADKRQYTPDFYLKDYGIYLEHFGVDRNGNPPHFFTEEQKKEYRDGLVWKPELHRKNKTKLICTYSYMRSEGLLTRELERLLVENGVILNDHPIDFKQLLRRSDVSQFVQKILSKFLGLYKVGGFSTLELRKRAEQFDGMTRLRTRVFLDVFEIFYSAYERELAAQKKIDFGDMITRALDYVENRYERWGGRYSYIIVDEFQDTAMGSVKLIRAVAAKSPGCKLYFVGDDWQSIYRFSGSDVTLVQDFEKVFKGGRVVELGNNYRSRPNIVRLGEKFILRNPRQRKKTVRAVQTGSLKNLVIKFNREKTVGVFIRNMWPDEKGGRPKIFFLGRYNEDKPEYLDHLAGEFKDRQIEFMSIHASKGLEADYVFLVPPKRKHFPSTIAEDPLLDLVAAPRDGFSHSEERRLMYVAITRARKQVFFIEPTDAGRMPFFQEIQGMLN